MTVLNVVVQGLLLGGLYALYAVGLSLIFGVMRIVNLAHGDFSILAAFIALLVVDAFRLNPLVSLLAVVPVMFLVGFVLQRAILNLTLSGDEMRPILVTFGLSIIMQNALLETFTADSQGLDAGFIENSSITLTGDLAVGWFPLVIMGTAIVVITGLNFFLTRTQLGRAFRAASDDQEAVRLMGVNNQRVYALAMGISLAIVALAGVIMGIRTTFDPTSGPLRLIFAYETVIIGGLGSSWGTLLGGMILGVSQALGAYASPGWGVLAGHLVFLAVLALRPQGLLPKTANL
ncbi:MAG: branched-chain amino acid ABC transporter permease [Thermoleophilia bacterium]